MNRLRHRLIRSLWAIFVLCMLCMTHSARAVEEAPPRVVAVVPLHIASEDPAFRELAVSLSEVITNLLSEGRRVTVVERTRLAKVLEEQKLQASGLVDPATAARVGQLLGANLMMTGSLLEQDGTLRLVLNVLSVDGQEVRGTLELPLRRDRIAEDLLAAGPRLAELADVAIVPPKAESLDDSPWGRLHLMRGLSCYAAKEYDQAIVHLLRAIRVDPRLVEARIWIIHAYLQCQEIEKAKLELAWLRRHSRAKEMQTELSVLAEQIAQARAKQQSAGER